MLFTKCVLSSIDVDVCLVKDWHLQGFAKLDETQADAILEMRLARLVGLERDKLLQEGFELLLEIKKLLEILSDTKVLMQVIKSELIDIKQQFATPRRSFRRKN